MSGSASTDAHRAAAAELVVRCAVIIVSDSRTVDTDVSGPLATKLIEAAGHVVVYSTLLKNIETQVRDEVMTLVARDDVDVIVLSGGTGLGVRDRTVEAVRPLLQKELPGFGELFRWVSFQEQIGTAALLTRAFAGAARGRLIVALPGSSAAVELALTRLLLPELGHLVGELRR
jgi:molybdenum cofactor biosynthesis protein B